MQESRMLQRSVGYESGVVGSKEGIIEGQRLHDGAKAQGMKACVQRGESLR